MLRPSHARAVSISRSPSVLRFAQLQPCMQQVQLISNSCFCALYVFSKHFQIAVVGLSRASDSAANGATCAWPYPSTRAQSGPLSAGGGGPTSCFSTSCFSISFFVLFFPWHESLYSRDLVRRLWTGFLAEGEGRAPRSQLHAAGNDPDLFVCFVGRRLHELHVLS